MRPASSSWARAYAPPARRGHRAERRHAGDYVPAPFARVNQDCVDIVGYAACSVDAVLQLRRVSRGVAAGVMNHFALVYRRARGGKDVEDLATFIASERTVDPLVSYLEPFESPEDPTAIEDWWPRGTDPFDFEPQATGRHVFLAALYCNAPLKADYDAIELGYHPYITENVVRSMVSRYPHVTTLDCGFGREIHDAGLLAVARNCTALRKLSLWVDSATSESSFLAVTATCRELEQLSLGHSAEFVSASVLASIGRHCPQLKFLDLDNSIGLGVDANINNAARWFGNLTELRLKREKFWRVDCIDAVVIAFAENCPRLTDVRLTESDVTDAALVALASKCPNLHEFHVLACSGVTERGVGAIARHCQHLTILVLQVSGSCTANMFAQLAAARARQLRVLDVSGSYIPGGIDVESVAALLHRCKRLVALFLCRGAITDAEMAPLHEAYPACTVGC